jgi:hypothetical protein
MGEFADLTPDQMDDLSFCQSELPPSRPRRKTCKYCGCPNLEWRQIEHGWWRLFTSDGKQHDCPEYWQAKKKKKKQARDRALRDERPGHRTTMLVDLRELPPVRVRSRSTGYPKYDTSQYSGEWDEFDEILGNFGDWGSQ